MAVWLPVDLAALPDAGLKAAVCFGCLSRPSTQRLLRMRRVASTSDVDEGIGLIAGPNVELSGRQRQAAKARCVTLYEVPHTGPWRPAVGAPLERQVRHLCALRAISLV
jgi:hypothetical protein